MSEDWDIDIPTETEVHPSPEEIEEEEKREAAMEALAAKKKMNVFERLDFDRKRQSALKLWVPPPERGHGRQIRGTIDVNVGLFISHLIVSKRWPWTDENSFVRSAIKCLIATERLDHDEEYAGYFKTHWEACRRAQLIRKLKDTATLVNQIELAVKAHLDLEELDQAAEYLRGEMEALRADDSAFSRAVLKKLEIAFTQGGGPSLLAVWRRV